MERWGAFLPQNLEGIRINPIFAFGFIYTLSYAVLVYFNSTIIEEMIGKQAVSVIYVASAILTIGGYSIYQKIIDNLGYVQTTLSFLCLNALALAAVALTPHNVIIAIASLIIHLIIVALIALSADYLLESTTDNKQTGTIRGAYLSMINTAFLIAPFIGGVIATRYGTYSIYLVASIAVLTAAAVFYASFKPQSYDLHISAGPNNGIRKTIRSLPVAYRLPILLQLLLQMFYATMVIYTPIFLIETVGLSFETVGIFISGIILAFIITQYPVGRYFDKNSPTWIVLIGLILMAGSLIALSFNPFGQVLASWFIIMFLSRIGAAIIEVYSETSFFKVVEASDRTAIQLFRTILPLSYALVPLIGFAALSFGNIKTLFITLGFAILIIGLSAIIKSPQHS